MARTLSLEVHFLGDYILFMNRMAIMGCVLVFLLGFAPTSANDFTTFVEAGDRHYHSFDNYAALNAYRRAYELAPGEFEPLVRMIRIHNDIGRSMLWRNDSAETWYQKAVNYAEELMRKYPSKAESHFWVALARGSLVPFRGVQEKLDIGKFVVHHAREAVRIDSTFGPAYVVLGILYREAAKLRWYEEVIANVVFGGSLPGTIEDSEQALLRAIRLNPDDIFAHYELARTYEFLEDHPKAEEHLRRALKPEPRSLRERDQQQRAARQLGQLQDRG